ncbi:hypothetical protein ACLB2K_016189 [Fragaria x ananassa]
MEATLERLPLQNSNTDITTSTNGGNIVVYSLEEGEGSPRNGSHDDMLSDKISGGTNLLYGPSSHGGDDSLTSEIVNVRLQKRVDTNHQDEDTSRKQKDLGSSSSSKQSTEEIGVLAKHRKVKLTDLAGVFEKTAAQEFYCPKCKACITEVLIGGSKPILPPPLVHWPEEPLSPTLSELEEPLTPLRPQETEEPPVRCTSCFTLLFHAGDWIFHRDQPVPTEQVITVPDDQMPLLPPRDANNKRLEIIKSIVYGGLTEAIASLSIVASAASADTATVNIFVLALANLLGGLFIIGHNLWELKADQDDSKYQEVLGNKENFFFHSPVAILSFLVFGLVPPLVYGFSFPNSDDSDLKIAAVAGSSLLCIILLAIGKAYIQTPPKKYIKTVLYYVVIGVGVAGLSYLAGDLIDKLVRKLGWFSSAVAGGLPLPHQTMMSTVKPAWESW